MGLIPQPPLAKVIINGREVETVEDDTFSTTVELEYGENTITVNAAVEGQASVIKTVTLKYIASG
ncbi:MAG: hypothetical protein JSW24_00645 [Dehalococcoidia bacterium]|nr:MAG: hypothetical protein JSW24_00645 [Dehalococcoidia bacterium]